MEIKQISMKLSEDILKKIDEDAKKENRDRTKQILHMITQYYEMKKLLNR